MTATAAATMNDFDDCEARRIAEDLTGKYGSDALGYITARTDRAAEVGDEIAQAIWRRILAVTTEMLRR